VSNLTFKPRRSLRIAIAFALGLAFPVWAQDAELVVSTAASVADVMTELAALYRAEAGVTVRVNTGGSNTLARQIVEGAPADVFLSADQAQMDIVDKAGRVVPGSRTGLLTNTLVIVEPASGSGAPTTIASARDLSATRIRRIAMGNPDSVPAGVYGRQWLERAGVWAEVSAKVVPFPTVRAALSAVQEGRVDAGIVYATDARSTDTVRVALAAPSEQAPAVVYPIAAIRGAREQAAVRFLAWLRGDAASRAFVRAGFGVARAPAPKILVEGTGLGVPR
jgi:molybdate transport system substrate-binding protein